VDCSCSSTRGSLVNHFNICSRTLNQDEHDGLCGSGHRNLSPSNNEPLWAALVVVLGEVSETTSTNASPCRLPSRAKTKAMNLHHRHRPPSMDRLTSTLHYYKKVMSILVTLSTTQPRLYFALSIARAPKHRSSTRCRRSLSPSSYADRPSPQ
jgi:hypothetical protein